MTIDEVKAELKKMDPAFDEGDENCQAAIVLLSSLEVGTSIRKLREFTGLPSGLISKFSYNLRKSGVWRDSKVYADWADEESGGVSFTLDTLVATGMMQRSA